MQLLLERYSPPPERRIVYSWLFGLVIISGPWFLARFHSSISLTDIFLILIIVYALLHWSDASNFFVDAQPMWLVAGIFAASVIYSLVIPLWVGSEIDFWRATVTIGQYGCFFFIFPLLAGALNSSMTSQTFVRLVALAYLLPLLVQQAYSVCENCAPHSDQFFSAGRALLSYENANSAAIVISITIPFFITLFLTEKVRGWCAVGLVGILVSISCLLWTGSMSGIVCFVGAYGATVLAFLILKPRRTTIFLRAIIASILGIAVVIGTVQSIVQTRPKSDQLRYRIDFIHRQMEQFLPKTESKNVNPRPATSPPRKTEIRLSVPDLRTPSTNVRLEFMLESLDSVRRHLFGVYGKGIGQVQALNGERITHLVYLLLLEEGGWPLLLSYLALFGSLYRNLWRSEEPLDYRTCFALALTALMLGGFFQTHMYARFYWIPLLFAFARPRQSRVGVKREEAQLSSTPIAIGN